MPGALAIAARLKAEHKENDPLSPREREVATLVMKAWTNRQIAEKLVLSERTIESHVRSILAKLNYTNRTELIAHPK
jgi:DNA-binding NarL/FixJ family response regulator